MVLALASVIAANTPHSSTSWVSPDRSTSSHRSNDQTGEQYREHWEEFYATGSFPSKSERSHPLLRKYQDKAEQLDRHSPASEKPLRQSGHVELDEWVVKLQDGADPEQVAQDLGLVFTSRVVNLPSWAVFTAPADHPVRSASSSPTDTMSRDQAQAVTESIGKHSAVLKMHRNQRPDTRTLSISDPSFDDQWHLINTGQGPNAASANRDWGQDVNVQPAWDSGITGDGVWILVVDDSLEKDHPDIAPNYRGVSLANPTGDGPATDPSPRSAFENHGTAVGGLAAAAADGSSCGVGTAYEADVAGVRAIGQLLTRATFASIYTEGDPGVSCNSWGYSGDVDIIVDIEADAIEDALENKRGGLGRIFLWAAGNDDITKDVGLNGFSTVRGVMMVGGSGTSGLIAEYATSGAGIFVNCPTMDLGRNIGSSLGDFNETTRIVTSDVTGPNGYISGDCGDTFSGTSASTPICAGITALILQENEGLHWRDVFWIVALSAERNAPKDGTWITNGAGLQWSPSHGFGRMNAAAAVSLASNWTNVGAVNTVSSGNQAPSGASLPQSTVGNISSWDDTWTYPTPGTPQMVEDVRLTISAFAFYARQYQWELTSPQGTRIVALGAEIQHRDQTAGSPFTLDPLRALMVHGFRGEDPDGTWTLTIVDLDGETGSFGTAELEHWSLEIYSIDDGQVNVTKADVQRTFTCGNGVREFPEECDDAGASPYCNANCTLICECGDGIVNSLCGETCDHGGTPTATCGSVDPDLNRDRLRLTGSPDGSCQVKAANDEIEYATVLPSGTTSVLFDNGKTSDASVSSVQPHSGCGFAQGGYDLWYNWTAPTDGTVQFTTCAAETDFDTFLNVYNGTTGTRDELVACNDDWKCGADRASTTPCMDVRAGETFLIQVSGWKFSRGEGRLDVLWNEDAECVFCRSWTVDQLSGFDETINQPASFLADICPSRATGNFFPLASPGAVMVQLERLNDFVESWETQSSLTKECTAAIQEWACGVYLPSCQQDGYDFTDLESSLVLPCTSVCVGLANACPTEMYEFLDLGGSLEPLLDCTIWYGFPIDPGYGDVCEEQDCPNGETSCWDTDDNPYQFFLDPLIEEDTSCTWCDIPFCPEECENGCRTNFAGATVCACSGVGCYTAAIVTVSMLAVFVGAVVVYNRQHSASAVEDYDRRKAEEAARATGTSRASTWNSSSGKMEDDGPEII